MKTTLNLSKKEMIMELAVRFIAGLLYRISLTISWLLAIGAVLWLVSLIAKGWAFSFSMGNPV